MPSDMSHEQKLQGLRELMNQKNSDLTKKMSPFEKAFYVQDHAIITALIGSVIDKFDDYQLEICSNYVFDQCHVNFESIFFSGPKLKQIVDPLYPHIEDLEQFKDDLLQRALNEKPAPSKRVLSNLHYRLSIGPKCD